MERIENLNIKQFKELITPRELKKQLPETSEIADVVAESRKAICKILRGKDKRRIVITGPCSLHDTKATLEYARRLKALEEQVSDKLLLVMRTYFEKPRTVLGWKGMLYDPYLDDSYDIEAGFRKARDLLISIGKIGVGTATEFLDPIAPQYLADLISWAAIGARTAESQIHRQMASGLSMPIGFKNSVEGNLHVAIDAVKAANSSHSFMGVNDTGKVVIAETNGNKYGHIVMRGGSNGPNYGSEYVAFAKVLLKKAGVKTGIIIDCSHANSFKDHKKQRQPLMDIIEQIKNGDRLIKGIMLESFLKEGNQPFVDTGKLKYGISLTDKCIGWNETEELIRELAEAVEV